MVLSPEFPTLSLDWRYLSVPILHQLLERYVAPLQRVTNLLLVDAEGEELELGSHFQDFVLRLDTSSSVCVKQVFSIREEWFKSIFTPELTVFPIFPPPTLAIELLAQFEELVVEDPRPDSTLRATVFPLCLQGPFPH